MQTSDLRGRWQLDISMRSVYDPFGLLQIQDQFTSQHTYTTLISYHSGGRRTLLTSPACLAWPNRRHFLTIIATRRWFGDTNGLRKLNSQ